MRRRDKRELAELHKALAAAEETQRRSGPPSPAMSVPLSSSKEERQSSSVSMVGVSSSSSDGGCGGRNDGRCSGGGGFGSGGDGGVMRDDAAGCGGFASTISCTRGTADADDDDDDDDGDDVRVSRTRFDAGTLASNTNASTACSARDTLGEDASPAAETIPERGAVDRDRQLPSAGSTIAAGAADSRTAGVAGGGSVASLGSDCASTASRVGLLVRMGLLRARLDRGRRKEGEGVRPVAERLWREVEDLAVRSRAENVPFRLAGDY